MSVEVAQPGLRSPQQLYEDWERAHWAAQDVDLNRDPADWAALAEGERNLLYWVLSSLMVAEERISTQFCGLVLAQDDEEEGSYLSTQLVDEVRHMQFYARFQNEVIADPAAIARACRACARGAGRPVQEGVRRGARGRPRPAAPRPPQPRGEGRLRDDLPHDHRGHARDHGVSLPARLPRASAGVLPGFVDGYGKIAADEQRHIAWGTYFLRSAVQADPAMADVVKRRLFDLLPAVAESVSPPSEGAWDVLGVEDGALGAYGLNALTRRLKIIGVTLEQAA